MQLLSRSPFPRDSTMKMRAGGARKANKKKTAAEPPRARPFEKCFLIPKLARARIVIGEIRWPRSFAAEARNSAEISFRRLRWKKRSSSQAPTSYLLHEDQLGEKKISIASRLFATGIYVGYVVFVNLRTSARARERNCFAFFSDAPSRVYNIIGRAVTS